MLCCLLLTWQAKARSDARKLGFTLAALKQPDPFQEEIAIDPDIVAALTWQGQRTANEAMAAREKIVVELEREAAVYWCACCHSMQCAR